jgi:hypothetical protein
MRERQLGALAASYKDRKPDLADLDAEDFRVFRRNKREIIPMISPP